MNVKLLTRKDFSKTLKRWIILYKMYTKENEMIY